MDSSGDDFFHGGWHPGRAYAYMCGNARENDGIVLLFNTDIVDDSNNVHPIQNEILDAFTELLGWPNDEDCR